MWSSVVCGQDEGRKIAITFIRFTCKSSVRTPYSVRSNTYIYVYVLYSYIIFIVITCK